MADTTEITTLLNGIQSKIAIVEGGSYDVALLEEIKEESLKLLDILKLFLISERDAYYGYFLMNMVFETDFKTKFIAGIRLNSYPPVFAFNPLIFCKFDIKECIYIVCHEIDHILLDHPTEMVKANPTNDPETFKRFNLAADASVNDRLNHEIATTDHGDFMAQPDGLITSGMLAKMFRLRNVATMENYAYYYELIKEKKENQDSPKSNPDSMMGKKNQQGKQNSQKQQSQKQLQNNSQQNQQGKGESQDSQKPDDKTQSQQNGSDGKPQDGDSQQGQQNGAGGMPQDGNGQQGQQGGSEGPVATANSAGEFVDHEWNAGDDTEETRAVVRELVNSAEKMMDDESRGNMPAHFASLVEKINTPPSLSWQQILKKYVGTISANKRKTRTRLNRRQPLRFDLSGQMDDKVLKIVVAIDTSASVDNKMIGQIFNEIFAILAKRKHEITVIECDAKVQRVYQAKTADDIKEKVLGRGGTCFTPVIKYLNDHKDFRDALLIYFTDGCGEQTIPKPRTYRNIWAVIGDENQLSLKEPYGIKVTVKL
jgi:Uncharacterized protein conserved in bacteria